MQGVTLSTAMGTGGGESDDAGAAALRQVLVEIERYWRDVPALPLASEWPPAALQAVLAGVDFAAPMSAQAAICWVTQHMRRHQVHAAHPRYFGLFVPRVPPLAVAGEALTAAFNPQLASWSHSPFAVAVEEHLIRSVAARFGYSPAVAAGAFTSGASEANQTALLCALARWSPRFISDGVLGLPCRPLVYLSMQAHHSLRKALRACGLGERSLRIVPTDARFAMDLGALERQIARDRREGGHPLLVAATAGSTASGAVDPLEDLARIARREALWLHVDAAWAGAAAWLSELAWLFAGLEHADSIAFDPHKWLSMPLGAGMYLTRHAAPLRALFAADAGYLPRADAGDPLARSLPCSRRFSGLSLFLCLAVSGWDGCIAAIRARVAHGRELRIALRRTGWRILNRTPLPLVCFADVALCEPARAAALHRFVVRELAASGTAWLSEVEIASRPALRACITNAETQLADVQGFVDALGAARASFLRGH